MTDNLPVQFQPQVLAAHMDYAKALAASDLLPRQYQGKPANLLWAISYGQTLGVDPMTAVQSIHVINGRPTASADLIAGLVRRAGHKLRVSGDDRKAVAQIVRADDPGFTFEATWTIDRAQAAKLVSKDTWKQFPAAMLKARAITEVARAACSEILQGTIYTPEELGARVDADGIPIEAEVTQLRRVQPGEADPWATAAPQPIAKRRDYLHDAYAAPDVETIKQVWRDARADGAAPEYLEQIAAVGRERAAGTPARSADEDVSPEVAASPAADEPLDVEVVPDVPADDHAAAVAELRSFAAQVGIDDIDRDATGALGLPLDEASAHAIRGLLAQLRGNAA